MLLAVNGAIAVIPALSACALGKLVGVVQAGSVSTDRSWQFVIWLSVTLGLLLFAALGKIIANYVSARLSQHLELEVSCSVLRHAATLDQKFFEDLTNQDELERAKTQPGKTYFDFVINSIQTVSGMVQAIAILAVLLWIDWAASLLLVCVGLPMCLIHWRLGTARYQAQWNKAAKRRWTAYFMATCTSHVNTPTLKVYDLFPLLTNRFAALMGELNQSEQIISWKQALARSAEAILLTLALLVSGSWIGYRTITGSMGTEGFVAYWVAAAQFRVSFSSLLASAEHALERVLFLRDLRSFFTQTPSVSPDAGTDPGRLQGSIKLSNVTFSYQDGYKPAVRNVSLHVQPGELIALVGPNGAGKTTLAKLIMRLYNVSEGAIYVDDLELREVKLNDYHQQVAYVGHHPFEFETTVAENIALGNWRELLTSPERVHAVAQTLGIEKMISEMPAGYETRLGRRFGDYDISAGQWQKLAIARALARDPAILILDEPTANLDARYEFDLLSTLRSLAQGRTTIIISHRLGTLKMADRILVMDGGKIVDDGTHAALLNREGLYAELFHKQYRQSA